MLVWMEGEASSVLRTPKNLPFCMVYHPYRYQPHFCPCTCVVLGQNCAYQLFYITFVLFKNNRPFRVAQNSSWARASSLEAGFTISLVAEIHLRCIRRTTVPRPYELRLGSMTCQNDRSKNSYPSVTHFVCFGIISEAENGLQN